MVKEVNFAIRSQRLAFHADEQLLVLQFLAVFLWVLGTSLGELSKL